MRMVPVLVLLISLSKTPDVRPRGVRWQQSTTTTLIVHSDWQHDVHIYMYHFTAVIQSCSCVCISILGELPAACSVEHGNNKFAVSVCRLMV